MNIGASLVKYCLCLFNFIFVIFGTGLLAVGVWLVADLSSFITLLKIASKDEIRVNEYGPATILEQGGYIFIALGSFIFIISFLGYCGTMKESRFLLGAYAFFLILIFILEIVLVTLFIVYKKETEIETRNLLTSSIKNMYSTREAATPFTVTFDLIMQEGKCCGVNNGTDFLQATKFKNNSTAGVIIPAACCQLQPGTGLFYKPIEERCVYGDNVSTSRQKIGCFDKLKKFIEDEMNIAIVIGIAIGLLQLIGIIFTICVYKAIYSDYK